MAPERTLHARLHLQLAYLLTHILSARAAPLQKRDRKKTNIIIAVVIIVVLLCISGVVTLIYMKLGRTTEEMGRVMKPNVFKKKKGPKDMTVHGEVELRAVTPTGEEVARAPPPAYESGSGVEELRAPVTAPVA